MSDLANLVLASASLLRLVSILIALWLAWRFEPRVAAHFQSDGTDPPGSALRTLIRLALGAIFAVPLFDLVALLQQLGELAAAAAAV